MLFVALEHAGIREPVHVIGTATRAANDTIRPAKNHHEAVAVFVVLKVSDRFQEGCGKDVFAVHVITLHEKALSVNYIIANINLRAR
jgi:hypothetical protein